MNVLERKKLKSRNPGLQNYDFSFKKNTDFFPKAKKDTLHGVKCLY